MQDGSDKDMKQLNEQMNLGAFVFTFGHHFAAWRHPGTDTNEIISMDFYKELAASAERGKLDMLFLADSGSIPLSDAESSARFVYPEATAVLGALAAITDKIGIAATVSTTFNDPYNVARRFSTLDHLSKGRAAWNVVTSTKEGDALNYSMEKLPEHGSRYERAREFLDVTNALWDSWEDDALLWDKKAGLFADKEKVHLLEHRGESFSVLGPLNIPRSPQGRPVIIQAGTSPAGSRFAASGADVIFTACEDKDEAIRFYKHVKGLLPEFGREVGEVKILPGLMYFVGATEAEAKAKEEEFYELILPSAGVTYLSRMLNVDLSGYSIDEQLPDIPLEGNTSRAKIIMETARRTKQTIRELGLHFAVARGHMKVRGTPEQIADVMEDWFRSAACDGFNIMPPLLPGGMGEFVDQVVPVLQRRGLFRTEYSGNTLRDHLGLSRPISQFAASVETAKEG
ncbi:FMN-dependent oxidoreductase, nitrilotriacetate monooxygenase family [Paenibacillus algorifonticola]|uniref:FMN-dependent oxidoreductase, nitrilotriacetate monooxygenase family n=2 Tax=Paenibacillus algorifonticola TaxID=684063 RepID=A0A1I2BEE1_9BACL|nr:FMN-dependent oxidoreductase, nitrilotriacetate monooxygenase family [Paenibacillus algorifonticola]